MSRRIDAHAWADDEIAEFLAEIERFAQLERAIELSLILKAERDAPAPAAP